MAFHTAIVAALANPALSYVAELLGDQLDNSLTGTETPIISCPAERPALPSFDAIIALLSDGYGDKSARAAHHRADVVHEVAFCRSCHSVSTAASTAEPVDVRR
jgi:DNA-binding FadR family transcriptional regulator